MKTAGIRELKARLSHFLSEVRRGEVVLITDRGEVVAELRKPASASIEDPVVRALSPLVQRGELRLGDPSLRGSKRRKGMGPSTTAEEVERELADVRAEDDREMSEPE
jgi:antitoxin (DNA-binding transcriptional repressor) of toxin-antitoxin stability system